MKNECYCAALRYFLDRNNFMDLKGHQDRCLVCMNAIIDEKNRIVEENYKLLAELAKNMKKCSKCDKPSEYDSPAVLCGEHWAEWMSTNQPDDKVVLTPEESKTLYDETMDIVNEARKNELN